MNAECSLNVAEIDGVERTLMAAWTFAWDDDANELVYKPTAKADLTQKLDKKKKGGNKGKQRVQSVPRAKSKHQIEDAVITLDNVKEAAAKLFDENFPKPFRVILKSHEFDCFLCCLFYYFKCYFLKNSIIGKLNPRNIAPSAQEQLAIDAADKDISDALRQLGHSYGFIVVGLGSCAAHHMNCGKSRVSNTLGDRVVYDSFYDYLDVIVWIVFKRHHGKIIKEEIGRLLRTSMFNPSIRKQNFDPYAERPELDGDFEIPKVLNESEYQRTKDKRPAASDIINLRSPTLSALMPQPWESSKYLFSKTKTAPPKLGDDPRMKQEPLFDHIDVDALLARKLGIIGDLLVNYNPTTLLPLTSSEDSDEMEKTASMNDDARESHMSRMSSRVKSRQGTKSAISRATTEVASDDEN